MIETLNKELEEVLAGLKLKPKRISSKYFYDTKGSELFDQITMLEEYYLTRTERKILADNLEEISSFIKLNTLLIEPGSGSNKKIKFLLNENEHFKGNISAYMPIDVSEAYMHNQADDLQQSFPNLKILPLPGDYTRGLPEHSAFSEYDSKLIFYPGSSLGNFDSEAARGIISDFVTKLGSGGQILIGLDLYKDREPLEAAYNDSLGITGEFNLNALSNLNSIFASGFNLENFRHLAFFNEPESRVEMHLESLVGQVVRLGEEEIIIKESERILTEYSNKYKIVDFGESFKDSLELKKAWTDENKYFALLLFEVY